MFMCCSTCFGRLHAPHQEPTTASTASGFTLERGGSSAVGRGLAGYEPARPLPTTCETVASGWLIYSNCMMMHGPANIKLMHTSFFRIYLFQFSTCFEHPCAHHQENQLY
jgi:hypothetical protein